MKKSCLFLVVNFWCFLGFAQTQQDFKNGYWHKNDTTTFVFSENVYSEKPAQWVVITGQFRDWSQEMNDKGWQLIKENGNEWFLKIYNPNYEIIKPGMAFKYRIDKGKWLDPPADATNKEGGNLVFMKGLEPTSMSAELISDDSIVAFIHGEIKPSFFELMLEQGKAAFTLKDSKGNIQVIDQILPTFEVSHKDSFVGQSSKHPIQIEIRVKPSIDKRRVYYLEIPKLKLKSLCNFDGWFKQLKSDKELGANISTDGKSTSFRVFAPRATAVKLYLYKPENSIEQKAQAEPFETQEMKMDEQGVWESILPTNLEGVWYDFTVHGFDDPGNSFFETHPVHVSDPYARVSDDSFGKCRVVEKTKPALPLKNGRPKMENVIAYEVHIQDFTDLLPVSDDLKGCIPAMGMSGLKNSKGYPIGFDHLTKLGINTVHIMPVQEMLHWPKDEWYQAFKDDPYMKEQGIANENYDWGYRTSHSFAIETRYRQKGTAAGQERIQFRDLVQKFHENNIAVVVDLVFNHTAENMDGRNYLFHFNAFDKQYYYRTKNLDHIGEYGNETKSENRYMVQRWIIDQCKHFIEEFGVDGFRIDLAGQTDKQTLLALKAALPKDIIIYGEPWIDSKDPAYNKNPEWHWYKEDAPICYFNDDTRNTYKGPVFELKDKETDRGWAGGNTELRDQVKLALTCGFPTQKNIISGINYLDIHDNFALADQFATRDFDGRFGVDEANYKIAATLLFTTPGPIVLHGGSEFMRSKGMAPLKEVVREIPSGRIYFHGKRDTYNMRNANQFVWENIGNPGMHLPAGIHSKPYQNADYKNMLEYWQGLIQFRKRYLMPLPAYSVNPKSESDLPKNAISFIEPLDKHLLGYIIEGKIFVLLNTSGKEQQLSLSIPKGKWTLVGNSNGVAIAPKFGQYQQKMDGGKIKLKIDPIGIMIWVKE